jgi:hypothetical protein
MITDEQIKVGYKEKFGVEIAPADLEGFKELVKGYGCEDAKTWNQAYEAVKGRLETEMFFRLLSTART